jgi:hypothetical protein
MGVTDQGLEFLLSARRGGVSFDRTMTIGRQFLLVPTDRAEVLTGVLAPEEDPALAGVLAERPRFAEPVLRALGAREVCSIDRSRYEGATHVHDLNRPLPATYLEPFSVVLDGGCLEHVFDFPMAIRNCMQMVAVGGHLLCMPPVNNAAGHGFYQFSPELYFRVLSPENGFAVERILLAEVRPDATWYQVVDPAVAGRRGEFTTQHQAYLYVQARKVDERVPFASPPVQSDYDDLWRQAAAGATGAPAGSEAATARPRLPLAPVRSAAGALVRRHAGLHRTVRQVRLGVAQVRGGPPSFDPELFEPLGPRLS